MTGADRHPRSPTLMVSCLVLGPLVGGYILVKATDTGDELASAATTVVVDKDWGKNREDRPIIEVDGKRYTCSPGEQVTKGATVRYDARDPSNCRLDADIGRRTTGQTFLLGWGVAVGLGIIALGLWRPERRRR